MFTQLAFWLCALKFHLRKNPKEFFFFCFRNLSLNKLLMRFLVVVVPVRLGKVLLQWWKTCKSQQLMSEAKFCSHDPSSMGRPRALLHRDIRHHSKMQPSQLHGIRVCQAKRRQCMENGAWGLKFFHSGVTHIKSTHILLAKASRMVMHNFKGMEKCNVCPEGEENQKYWWTAEMSTTVSNQQAGTMMCPFLGQVG